MKKETISIIYKVLVALCLLTGILLNVINTTSITAILSYYTLQSNIICLAMFIEIIVIMILYKEYRFSDIYYILKGGITIAILITIITYQVALVPNNFHMDVVYTTNTDRYWANLFVHIISPIMVIGDYILFDEKGNFKLYYPFIWLCIPLYYVLYVYTYSAKGGHFYGIGGSRKFAYIFLDYNQYSIKNGYLPWPEIGSSTQVLAIIVTFSSFSSPFLASAPLPRSWRSAPCFSS